MRPVSRAFSIGFLWYFDRPIPPYVFLCPHQRHGDPSLRRWGGFIADGQSRKYPTSLIATFCPGSLRMNFAMTGIKHKLFIIRARHQRFRNLLPDTFVPPPTKAVTYSPTFPMVRWLVAPRRSGARPPKHTIDKSAAVRSYATPLSW